MNWPVNPLRGNQTKPLTGEPCAGNPPARFGGGRGRNQSVLPTPIDEEFLLAALLHDVGKAIDPSDHVGTALEALEGSISERTAWLIEHHMEAQAYRDGTLGHRARIRLQASEYFDDLLLLHELDRRGRVQGAFVCELDEALAYIRGVNSDDAFDP